MFPFILFQLLTESVVPRQASQRYRLFFFFFSFWPPYDSDSFVASVLGRVTCSDAVLLEEN